MTCILAFSAVVLHLQARQRLSASAAAAIVGALCVLDLLRFGYNYNPLVPPGELRRQPPLVAALQRDGMRGRIFQSPMFESRDALGFWTRSWPHVRKDVALLRPNHNLRWGVPHAGGYSTLATEQHMALQTLLAYASSANVERVPQTASIAYRIEPGSDDPSHDSTGWPPVRITRVPDPLPRVYVVGAAVPASGHMQALSRALSESFDPRAAVVLEPMPAGAADMSGPLGEASARIVRETSTRVEIECETPGRAVLVLTDMFYPGWAARVDGRPARIYRANGLFRAVTVDSGHHRVVFRYRPGSLHIGAMLSLLSLVGLIVAWATQGWAARRRTSNL